MNFNRTGSGGLVWAERAQRGAGFDCHPRQRRSTRRSQARRCHHTIQRSSGKRSGRPFGTGGNRRAGPTCHTHGLVWRQIAHLRSGAGRCGESRWWQRGCASRLARNRSQPTRPDGASTHPGRAAAGRRVWWAPGGKRVWAGGRRGYPAGRRRTRRQRYARQEHRADARAREPTAQAGRTANPAQRHTDLRSGRAKLISRALISPQLLTRFPFQLVHPRARLRGVSTVGPPAQIFGVAADGPITLRS
jgi:hypothetical protein